MSGCKPQFPHKPARDAAVCTKVSQSAQTVGDADLALLAEHGFSDEDIWDIGAVSAFFALSNLLTNRVNLRPNDDFFLMGRLPKA